jgi:diguanylate cyclase (GGDEF)-like protein
MLSLEAVAVAVLAVSLAHSPEASRHDWINFAILAAGATIHIQLTQRQEERRRNRTKTVLIDLTAVWTFSAAMILPVPLSLLIVLLVRAQHWFIARRPAHNFIFSSITHGLAAVLAHITYTALGPHFLTPAGWAEFLREFGAIAVTGVVYEAVQILYVGGALALGLSSEPTVRNVLGSTADNVLEAITIGLGAVTAVLLAVVPPMVAVMTAAAVIFNRLAELDQLRDDVRTDPKTGLLNMRGWSESAARALERSARSKESVALLMIDLDHFKWINDTYGHPAGDDVLRGVAETLSEVTRPTDLVGRFGGEEFLVLLPGIDERATKEAAERVLSAVAKLHVLTTGKRGETTTIADRTTSIGVARYPVDGESLEQLLQAADSAVYAAKEGGRNQVRFAPASQESAC